MATLQNLTVSDTGFLRIPKGTTAQRPGTPQSGMLRFNTDYLVNEYYNGTAWVTMGNAIASASGGTATGNTGAASIGGSKIVTFTSGTGTFTPVYSGSVEVFMVGGGGSGGGIGGGGGGGGVIYQGAFPVTGGVGIPVSVGGGAAVVSNNHGPSGQPGSNTTFGTLTARGGGGGGGYGNSGPIGHQAGPGGSGGGGPGGNIDGQNGKFGFGTTGQGHPGGWGHHGSTGPASQNSPQPGAAVYGGGGGGGAGEKGIPRWSWHADAKGGDGIASSIKGTAVQFYGGGGGGGGHSGGSHSRPGGSTGGLGGGGDARQSGPQAGHDAQTNSGGGGGGAHYPDAYRSGAGGPGIVVVRYKS